MQANQPGSSTKERPKHGSTNANDDSKISVAILQKMYPTEIFVDERGFTAQGDLLMG